MNNYMPLPVTRKSSKREILKELDVIRAENQQQLAEINNLRSRLGRAESEATTQRYQIGIIKAVIQGRAA